MKKIINFGSLNIDKVYTVEHFVQPGETLTSTSYHEFAGGKGLNQSIALSRAGADVYHAGIDQRQLVMFNRFVNICSNSISSSFVFIHHLTN